MKQILIDAYGAPEQVARCAEIADVGAPGPGEVVFDVLYFPINPADLAFCRGQYRMRPPLPATPGAECVGEVIAVGAGVSGVAVGDRVINLQRENWTQRRRVPARDVIVLPTGVDPKQAAMLRINPPTARLLLTDVVALAPGEWVLQNVANSAVGRLVIRMARARGWKTVNIVRRKALFDELTALGADACVLEGDDLAQQVQAATGGASIRLGLDAVGGAATTLMSACIADEGTVCHYGSMSGQEAVIPRHALIYRGVTLTGFMLGRFLARHPAEHVQAIYRELAADMLAGTVDAPIDGIHPIEDIRAALIHAQQGGRSGKVLVQANAQA